VSQIEYFYSAHSVFAYIGAARLMEVAEAANRRILHRPVNLGEVVAAAYPDGFAGRSKAHRAYYFGREIERWAEFRGVALKGGIPANHNNDMTLANSLLLACATDNDNVDQLAFAFMQAHWRDHADLADVATLRALMDAHGIDADASLEIARSAPVQATYAANTKEAIERSVFGSPTYVVDGDVFYGQDHLEMVERALSRPFK
jgi:2-hydroxychromene-2-carboxylate isomerase